jgi:O-antigen ligase
MFGKNLMSINYFSSLRLNNFFFYLLCFFPVLLVTGPFLPDLSLTLIIIYFVISSFIKKDFTFYKNSFFILFCLFYLYIFLNSIFISGEFLSIKSSIFYIRFGLFVLAISYLISKNLDKINFLMVPLFLTFLILFVDSIFQKKFGFNIIGLEMNNPFRVSSFFGDELILGSFVIKFLPILIALIYFSKIKKKNILSSIVVITSVIPILLSAEKSAIITYIILFFLFVLVLEIKIINKIFFTISLIVLILIILATSDNIKKRLIDNTISNSEGGKYVFSRVHDSHYRTAFKMFADKPLLGHGPKTFRIKCSYSEYQHDHLSCSTHPHNYYLQILAETGVIGFIFLIGFYLIFLKKFFYKIYLLFKKQKINKTNYFLICSQLLLFMPISVSGNFFNNWLAIIYSLSTGLYYFFYKYDN